MTTEAQILHSILLAWGAHPRLRIARINTGKANMAKPGQKPRWVRFNPKGTADIVGLMAPTGRMLMIECKSETGKMSPEQLVMQRVVTSMGGLFIPQATLADVDRVLIPLVGSR